MGVAETVRALISGGSVPIANHRLSEHFDRQDRTRGLTKDLLRDAAQEEMGYARQPVTTEHDEITLVLGGEAKDLVDREPADHLDAE